MKIRFLFAVISAAFLLCFAMDKVEACSCGLNPNPPCRAYSNAGTIFDGIALRVDKIKSETEMNIPRRVEFKVVNSYKGSTGKIIFVYTGAGASDCGYDFKPGRRYLVYASTYQGRFVSFKCGRNREIKFANEDIDFLRSLPTLPPGVNIFGKVEKFLPLSGDKNNHPIVGIQVQVDGSEKFVLETDMEGKFLRNGLKPGRYALKVIAPIGFWLSARSNMDFFPLPLFEEDVPDKGCIEANFVFEPKPAK